MRVLGLDYGSKTVGVAVSDPLGLTAQGVETVWRKQENKLRRTLARIEEIISEYQVTEIVLGYPKNMNNTGMSIPASSSIPPRPHSPFGPRSITSPETTITTRLARNTSENTVHQRDGL